MIHEELSTRISAQTTYKAAPSDSHCFHYDEKKKSWCNLICINDKQPVFIMNISLNYKTGKGHWRVLTLTKMHAGKSANMVIIYFKKS